MHLCDGHAASVVVSQLLFLESENPTLPINMYIMSPGGVITSGMAIYDTMQYISCPVHTTAMGAAMSMGSFLLCGGEPGQRRALPNAEIMLHQPRGGAQGTASDILIDANNIIKIRSRLNQIYSEATKQPVEVIERTLDRDTYMTAAEAKEFGVIDEVISKRPLLDAEKL